MIRPTPLALLLALVTLVSGCALGRTSVNEPILQTKLERLQPGKSTAAEVVAELGAPVDIVQLGKRSAYYFEHQKTKRTVLFLVAISVFNEDTRSDRVWVFFDEDGLLTHFGSTLMADTTKYAMPWEDIHE